MANKSGNPNWTKGKPRPEKAGRKKGTPNKISKNIKENFEAVFEKLGGVDGFFKWASKNTHTQSAFYQMYSKMLPSNVGIDGSVKHEYRLSMADLKKSLKAYKESVKRDWEYQKKHVINMEKIS